MRTTELSTYYSKLSEINNHLSHTIFVFKQFTIDNKELVKKYPKKLTTEIYNNTQYVKEINEITDQFNVRLKDVEEQAKLSLDYIFDTVFVMTMTYFEVYLKDAYLFVRNNSNLNLPEPPQSEVYKEIISLLNIDLENDIENLFVSTFDYFKFRRNAIMHRDREKRFQGAMEDLIKGKNTEKLFRSHQLNGTELNSHWKKHRENLRTNNQKGHTILNFDFTDKRLIGFSVEDLHDVFNFFRLYSKKLDQLILRNLNREELLKFCFDKYEKNYKSNLEKEKFAKYLKRTCKFELNLEISESEIEALYNDV